MAGFLPLPDVELGFRQYEGQWRWYRGNTSGKYVSSLL